jgi:bud site selection protein 31
MPKIRTSRTKEPPNGFEDIESVSIHRTPHLSSAANTKLQAQVLEDYAKQMRDAENEPHEGKRRTESLWPIMRISHSRSRYIYDLYYRQEGITKKLYDWLLKEGYADAK